MKKYLVKIYDSEKKEWRAIPLEMCSENRKCIDCKKDIEHLPSCDFFFYDTKDLNIAKVQAKIREEQGDKVRIEINE